MRPKQQQQHQVHFQIVARGAGEDFARLFVARVRKVRTFKGVRQYDGTTRRQGAA